MSNFARKFTAAGKTKSEGLPMFRFLSRYSSSEDGAVTVDWVVLTAAVVGLGITAISTVSTGTDKLGATVSNDVAATKVGLGN